MKSIRLNDTIRHEIALRLVEDKHPELARRSIDQNEKKHMQSYGKAFYNFLYSPGLRQRLRKAPKGMVPTTNRLRTRVVYETDQPDPRFHRDAHIYRKAEQYVDILLPKKLPVFHVHESTVTALDSEDLKELGWDAKALVQSYDSTCQWRVDGKRRDKMNEVILYLKNFTTTKQVLESWPEIEPYLPKEVEKKTPGKSLIRKPDHLNKMFGLV